MPRSFFNLFRSPYRKGWGVLEGFSGVSLPNSRMDFSWFYFNSLPHGLEESCSILYVVLIAARISGEGCESDGETSGRPRCHVWRGGVRRGVAGHG